MRAVVNSRRDFLHAGLGLASFGLLVGCGSLPPAVAQPGKRPRVGLLLPQSEANASPVVMAFQDGLRDLGYIDGQDITIEARYADGMPERFPDLASELVRLPVDVVVVLSTPAIQAVKHLTSALPIVVVSTGDLVGTQLIASLGRPGGNITGVSSMSVALTGKRLELLKAALPGATRVATIWNAADDGMNSEYGEAVLAARRLGLEVHALGVRTPSDIDRAYEAAGTGRVDAVVVMTDPLIFGNRTRLVDLSLRGRLPTISGDPLFASAGGLMSYGTSAVQLIGRTAYFVDRILKGAQPADLPVEQPTAFDFVINLKTAQALGLTLPPSVLQQATEVIQ